jgi:hypothetical protein
VSRGEDICHRAEFEIFDTAQGFHYRNFITSSMVSGINPKVDVGGRGNSETTDRQFELARERGVESLRLDYPESGIQAGKMALRVIFPPPFGPVLFPQPPSEQHCSSLTYKVPVLQNDNFRILYSADVG